MKSSCLIISAVALAAGVGAPAWVQAADDEERPLCADRPGAGTPPCVLDVGRWQIEAGVSGFMDSRDGVDIEAMSYGDLEVRVGLTPTLEAQVEWRPHVSARVRAGGMEGRASGSGDLRVAVRKSLRNPDGSGVSVAVQPFITAPTGDAPFAGNSWQGGVVIPVWAPLAGELGIGFSPQIDVVADFDGSGHHLAVGGGVGVGAPIGEVAWGAEVWTGVDDDPDGATTYSALSLSLAWTPKVLTDTQFDVGVDLGLNDETPNLHFAMGVARRF